jgi:hypothetical protein
MEKKLNNTPVVLARDASIPINEKKEPTYFERRMAAFGYEPENDSSWYESHPDSKKTNNPFRSLFFSNFV